MPADITQHIPDHLQQSVLTLLIFDDEQCHVIRNCLDIEVWDTDNSIFFLVKAIYNYIDAYKKCPGRTHIYELIYALPIPKEAINNLLERVGFYEDHLEEVNVEFTLSKLEDFHRRSVIAKYTPQILALSQRGEFDKAEELMHLCFKKRLDMFNPGSTLLEILTRKLTEDKTALERNRVYLGIPAFDDRDLVPTRKEIMVIGAGPGKGKSFFLGHIAKRTILEGKKAVYVTLELGEDQVGERIIQSLYAVTKRPTAQLNRLTITPTGFDDELSPQLKCLYDEDNETALRIADRLRKDRFINSHLYIKQFPMNALTFPQLNAFLDNLQMQYDFTADVLIMDYGKLMKKSGKDQRLAIGEIYEGLRAIATTRNMAVVTATQLSKEGVRSKRAENEHVAEDYSIIATSDVFITYNQTDLEFEMKLARLYCAKARNEEGGFEVYITQNYASGVFVLSSHEATSDWRSRYDHLVKSMKPAEDDNKKKVSDRT